MCCFKIIQKPFLSIVLSASFLALFSCSADKNQQNDSTSTSTPEQEAKAQTATDVQASGKGIGPVESVTLSDKLDEAMVDKGQSIFDSKCVICHAIDHQVIGPSMKGITKRRSPAWIMNMILNPQEMLAKDPVAKSLLEEYKTPMIDQNVSEEGARAVLEYLRSIDKS